MLLFDTHFQDPITNIACEEALLDFCEDNDTEALRFWQSETPFAVLGAACKYQDDLNLEHCQADKIPILRRCSGGGTILQGPGCLNATVVFNFQKRNGLGTIRETNHNILNQHMQALLPHLGPLAIQGDTDLTLEGLKISGNAQRRKRTHLLFHGTFLLNFQIELIERYLKHPPKEPDYRQGKTHQAFLKNLDLPGQTIQDSLAQHWQATEQLLPEALQNSIEALSQSKYSQNSWNLRF